MRVAFLIFNHRGQEQLLRLLGTLGRQLPDSPLVVHHDKFRNSIDAEALKAIGNTHLLTSPEPIVWGDRSFPEAHWRSMAWITANVQFDWLVVLSGQDYPIKPLAGLPDYLASTGADALMDVQPIGDLPTATMRRLMRRRYLYQYRPARTLGPAARMPGLWAKLRKAAAIPADVVNNSQSYVQVHRFPDRMPWRLGVRAARTPFSDQSPCWFGSAWYALSQQAVKYLCSYVDESPDYVSYYSKTVCPGESATATIVCNAPGIRVLPISLHYTRWTHPESGHPDIFGLNDVPALLAAPEFFARKFDLATDAQVLDRLDELVQQVKQPGDSGRVR